jgi:hypothetical protein
MRRRGIVPAILAGLACFALGIGAARFFGAAPMAEPVVPRIVFDPASIRLLPDASLRLDLPPGLLDAGPLSPDASFRLELPGLDAGAR